jgi:hypothetical protein
MRVRIYMYVYLWSQIVTQLNDAITIVNVCQIMCFRIQVEEFLYLFSFISPKRINIDSIRNIFTFEKINLFFITYNSNEKLYDPTVI